VIGLGFFQVGHPRSLGCGTRAPGACSGQLTIMRMGIIAEQEQFPGLYIEGRLFNPITISVPCECRILGCVFR